MQIPISLGEALIRQKPTIRPTRCRWSIEWALEIQSVAQIITVMR